MEIEENRGLDDKRILRISSQPFFSFSLEHSLFSHTLAHLEHCWGALALEKGSKGKARKSWIKTLHKEYLQGTGCMCVFLVDLCMHGTCMCVFGSLVFIGMVFARCDSGFILTLPFMDSHGVMGFFIWLSFGFQLWIFGWFWNCVRWSQENYQGPRNPLVGFGGIAVNPKGGNGKIPQGISEEILRHPSLFWA